MCRTRDVASKKLAGWDDIDLPHRAAPEVDFADVTIATEFLGQKLKSPFLISSMTGGSSEGEEINRTLAGFAQARGLAMGVGSQRVALENRDAKLFDLRKTAPRAVLYANIGLVQFNYGVTTDDAAWLVDSLEAQALILHLNPLQEAIQGEGDRNFSNLLQHIGALKKRLRVPVIVKETGCGLDVETSRRALDAGADALDLAGLGGTHWGFIEGLRDPRRQALGEIFRDWGIPSLQTLLDTREDLGPDPRLIASGGVRNGLDAAKALYLGANLVGMALPFLKAAKKGPEGLNDFLDVQEEALKIALFCCGHTNLEGFRL